MGTFPTKIKITARPQGEAPEWVRDAWIRCELTCVPDTCGHVPRHCTGVVSGAATTSDGYDVDQAHALQVLAARNRTAAGWWRERYFPIDKQCFRFDRACAEVLASTDACEGGITVHDDIETGTLRPY